MTHFCFRDNINITKKLPFSVVKQSKRNKNCLFKLKLTLVKGER